jgi:O-antigen/teichoic acid export membrane protein
MLLLSVVRTAFGAVVGSVIFPAISEVVRERPSDVRRVYEKFQLQTDLLLFSLSGFLYFSGPAIVKILYDNRYSEAGPVLAILSLGLISSRYVIAEQCFLAMDQVRYQAATNLLRALALCIGLPLGFSVGGLDGALAAILLAQFAGCPIAIYFEKANGLFNLNRNVIGVPVFLVGAACGWLADHALKTTGWIN